MTALVVAHGTRWAGIAVSVGLRAALGPEVADIALMQGAAMLAHLPRAAPRLA